MRLLGERYLGGKVSFTTSAEEGTVFTIRLPCQRQLPRGSSLRYLPTPGITAALRGLTTDRDRARRTNNGSAACNARNRPG